MIWDQRLQFDLFFRRRKKRSKEDGTPSGSYNEGASDVPDEPGIFAQQTMVEPEEPPSQGNDHFMVVTIILTSVSNINTLSLAW